MVTQISLGTFGQVNGKNVLTGGASQLDTQAIVKALTDAKRLPADRLTTANKTIDSKTSAYNDLVASFKTFKSAADALRNVPGVGVDSQNIFQYRTSSVTSSIGLTASNYLDVTAVPGANVQNHTIDSITQLAQASVQQTGTFTLADATTAPAVSAVPTAGMFTAGTVNLRAVDGTVGGIPLTLNATDSLQTVADKFNEVSNRTGIQATVVTQSSGSYRLIFSATKTGSTYGFDFNTAAPAAGHAVETDPSGVLSQITFAPQTAAQTAQDAIFSVDGISITRETNSVSDAISGLTFSLKQPGFVGTMNVAIKADTSVVANAITQFANAYNDFRTFVAKQTQLDSNSKPTADAVLYNDQTFRTIIGEIGSEVSNVVAGITGSGNPTELLDIGLTLQDYPGDSTTLPTTNILVVSSDQLNSALQSNFDGVRKLFEFQLSSDDTNFVNFKRSNNLAGVTSFAVNINRTTNIYQATYTDPATGGAKTVNFDYTIGSSGSLALTGQSGTIFEGSQFLYAGSAVTATVNASFTQGFGDRFYNLMDRFINTTDGLIKQAQQELVDSKTRNEDQIKVIDTQVTAFQDQQIKKYANLESAISKANQLLLMLNAQSNAQNGTNG